MKQKKGLMYKGCFWPLYGGGNLNKSVQFQTGGIENLSCTILAGNHNAAVVVEYEDGKDD